MFNDIGIIKDNSKKSKTTKFKYLATKEELQKLKPQTSIGAGVTLEVAERRVRRITTGEAILDNDDNNNNTNNNTDTDTDAKTTTAAATTTNNNNTNNNNIKYKNNKK